MESVEIGMTKQEYKVSFLEILLKKNLAISP